MEPQPVAESLQTPIKKVIKKSHAPPKPPTADSSVLAVNCCKIIVVGDKCRFICRHPGCEREYASRDAVRKHCRLRHLSWLRGLERTAVHDVEVLPPRDPSDPEPPTRQASPMMQEEERTAECVECDARGPSQPPCTPPPQPTPEQEESLRAAEGVVTYEQMAAMYVPSYGCVKPNTPGFAPVSPPQSPAFAPLEPPAMGREQSMSMLSPLVMPANGAPASSADMPPLPPLDLPSWAHVSTGNYTARFALDLLKNPCLSPRLAPSQQPAVLPLGVSPLNPLAGSGVNELMVEQATLPQQYKALQAFLAVS